MIDFDKMQKLAGHYGVSLSRNQMIQLDTYAELLVEWNKKMNLTAITDSDGIMVRHFEDSMAPLKFIDIGSGSKVIDVGTGAGFPGMVLKIVRPDLDMTLLDSLNKRLLFLNDVSEKIKAEVTIVHLRAEEGGKMPAYRERYDFAFARAVSNLRELAEYCLPYVKTGGSFVSMKGPAISEELNAARPGIGTLGGKVKSVTEYKISDKSERTVILIEKIKNTPLQYPRPSAKIQKKPL